MTVLTISLLVWGIVLTAFLALVFYRAYVTPGGIAQLFLSEAADLERP